MNKAKCEICGEPMPEGEEMFKYHGYSGNCHKPPMKIYQSQIEDIDYWKAKAESNMILYRGAEQRAEVAEFALAAQRDEVIEEIAASIGLLSNEHEGNNWKCGACNKPDALLEHSPRCGKRWATAIRALKSTE